MEKIQATKRWKEMQVKLQRKSIVCKIDRKRIKDEKKEKHQEERYCK